MGFYRNQTFAPFYLPIFSFFLSFCFTDGYLKYLDEEVVMYLYKLYSTPQKNKENMISTAKFYVQF